MGTKYSMPEMTEDYGQVDVWRISKEFHFSYSHQLHGLEEGHPCGRVHGHNGILVVELEGVGELNEAGFVRDYRELSPVKEFIDENVDHYHLNDVFDFQPSSENIAKWFYHYIRSELNFPNLARVGWSETPKTWCWYEEAR